jgi:glyceraldehyde-3-phosphate dehydrogenase/erythrose-4-phosphate dehydrogenase
VARIAVNGLGRIGRAFVKLAVARPELEIVAGGARAQEEVLCRSSALYQTLMGNLFS